MAKPESLPVSFWRPVGSLPKCLAVIRLRQTATRKIDRSPCRFSSHETGCVSRNSNTRTRFLLASRLICLSLSVAVGGGTKISEQMGYNRHDAGIRFDTG